MKGKVLHISESDITKKIVAMLLIIALTMMDFIVLSSEIISYAADIMTLDTATNNKNVTFDTYFKDGNDNVVSSKSESIDTETSLYIRISVKNDGYFNGAITLEKSNFIIRNEILSEAINKIDENTVTLNQINSGETVEFELKIKPLKEETINSGLLTMPSDVTINGIYRNSQERDINITSTRQVKLILASPYSENEGMDIRNSIITNKVYEINGEKKRLIQVLVESGLEGNRYPVKENKIEVSVPNGVENVEVISRGTLSTNGKAETEFEKTNWQYLEKEQKVNIIIKNDIENGTIKWLKSGKDRIIVTYTLNADVNLEGTDIMAKSTITMYDTSETVKQSVKTAKIEEEKDGVIGTEIELEEKEIYKGKIYSGENRDYNTTVNLYVNKNNTGKIINTELKTSTFETTKGEVESNIQFVNTTVAKSDITRILGKEGKLTILSDKKVIAEITSESKTDDYGNVIINYPDGIKSVKIETTEPTGLGTIALKNVKTIKQDGNSKDLKITYNGINEKTLDAEEKIQLKETETMAEVNINRKSLSTLAKNENVEITAVLKTDSEKYDLYKNPTIEITMPESIKVMNIKTLQPLYSDMFKVEEATLTDEANGMRKIRVVLNGEQTSYTTEVNQATIVIVGDIEFETLTPSNESKITMNYTNENGMLATYNTSKSIRVESKYGLMMNTVMNGYNENGDSVSTMDEEVAKGTLDLNSQSKVAKVKEVVVNNYDEAMQNVSIIGKIPTEGMNDGTVNTEFTGEIKTTIQEAKILYSKDENAKAGDNVWTENKEGAKAFKVNVGNLEKGNKVEAEYAFTIPENLDYGQSMYSKVNTEYTYLGNNIEQTSTVGAETPKLIGTRETTLKNSIEKAEGGIKAKIGTTTAGKELNDGDIIYEGQAIQYTVQITNNTGKDLKNVKISLEQENGQMYGLKDYEVVNDIVYKDTGKHIEHRYEELNTNIDELDSIDNFENGKTIQFKYEIVVNEVEGDANTQGTIKIKAEDTSETTIKTISNKIEQAELKLNYKNYRYEEDTLYYGNTLETLLTVENLSNKELKNIEGKIILPTGTYATEDIYASYKYDQMDTRINNVKYNKGDNTITFNILELKPGEDEKLTAIFYIGVEEFDQETVNLAFLAEAKQAEKTYYSNQMVKSYTNITKDVTINQEANISPDTILKDDDEFTITITAKNNTNDNVMTAITDELPECFVVTSAHLEMPNNNKNLDIVEYDNEDNIDTKKDSYILNSKNSGSKLNISERLSANEQIKVTLNIKVDIGIEQESVKNIVKLSFGQVEEDGRYKYVVKKENEKNFNIKPLVVSDEINYVEVSQTSNVENKSILKDGQEIIYNVKVKNISKGNVNLSIKDVLPNGIIVKQVLSNNENITEKVMNNNTLNIEEQVLSANQEADLKIVTNYNRNSIAGPELSNIVKVVTPESTVLSNPIVYYAQTNTSNNENNQEGINNLGKANKEETSGNYNYTLSGLAWLDENKNGQKDGTEKLLQGIEVKVMDVETGKFVHEDGKDLTSKTSENGTYTFKLQRGNYVVVFMYDSNKYAVTQYQKSGVSNKQNSDVISRTIEMDGTKYEVASTDTIKLISEDITNIDMGLLENTKFDFEFGKYISEITVKTSKGVNTYNYDNADLAKVEIHAKELNNASVIIKYNMKVTNNGEIAGYIKDITDYMPSTLTFNSELNTDWYQSGKNLHNTSLLNTKIGAGETKEITLILTKNMTENNTGLVSNIAELTDVSNEIGAEDLDSTPGNVTQGEDDLGKADIIIGVKTGALVTYIGVVLAILVVIGVGAYILNKKVLKNDMENIKF